MIVVQGAARQGYLFGSWGRRRRAQDRAACPGARPQRARVPGR